MTVSKSLALSAAACCALAIGLPVLASGDGGVGQVDAKRLAAARDTGQCDATAADWQGLRGDFTCVCGAGADGAGPVWGDGTYTSDSDICTAAVHSGVVSSGEGGRVYVEMLAGMETYAGVRRNGVTSASYSAWDASYRFLVEREDEEENVAQAAGPDSSGSPTVAPDHLGPCADTTTAGAVERKAPVSCDCTPDAGASGQVWGTDIYTDDSAICRAALHAGVIDSDGGRVTIEITPGRQSYVGTRRNGVTSGDYGAWGDSFRFVD